jgi:charged multivesicular body protein 7
MSVMLNTFRPKQVNEEHYNQKMKFWIEMVENYCEYKGSANVSIEELKTVFKRKGTVPYCLQDVLRQMSADGNIVEKEEFMAPPKSLAGWAVNSLLVKPLSWGIGKLKERIVGGVEDEQTVFVVKNAVRAQGKILLDHIRARHSYNNIISMDELMSGANDMDGVSKEGILLVLHHLCTEEKKVYIEENIQAEPSDHHHKILMKFAEPHKPVQPITEIERSIYNLEQTEKFLLKTIENKEHSLNEVLDVVKENLKNGKKQLAKTYLRKKHLMENDIAKNVDVLDNIQTMLQRVRSSKNDKDIISTYKMGSEAIKTAFAESGINLDNVHDIIEDMQEVFEDQKEIDAALGEQIGGGSIIDDKELEKELADLMNSNDGDNNGKPIIDDRKPIVDDKKTPEIDPLDLELEMRLRRLRSDLTENGELPTLNSNKNPRAGLTQL